LGVGLSATLAQSEVKQSLIFWDEPSDPRSGEECHFGPSCATGNWVRPDTICGGSTRARHGSLLPRAASTSDRGSAILESGSSLPLSPRRRQAAGTPEVAGLVRRRRTGQISALLYFMSENVGFLRGSQDGSLTGINWL
jgi:hypothetical protein